MTSIKWPIHGWLGILLIIIFWALNWSLSGLRTHWGFFPLWLGYCLTVDALVYFRKGNSLLSRSLKSYLGLFFVSAPSWWLFELINWHTHNWIYLGKEQFSDLQYFLFASLSFSTVMPAVFGTAELFGTFNWIQKLPSGPLITTSSKSIFTLFNVGILMLCLLSLWPLLFFPFIWTIVYFIVDPINVLLKKRSLINYTAQRDWRPVVALGAGCLTCGFFWEMWNFYSFPKWIYHVPYVDFWHVFEMPILGYLGYIPFAFELFAIYHLTTGLLLRSNKQNYVMIISQSPLR